MPRFFINEKIIDKTTIYGEDAKHIIKSLRYKCGDKLTLCDGNGTDYCCTVTSIDEGVTVLVDKACKNETESSANITLYQAIPKSDKLEFIIQKAVELGVRHIVPINTKYCISKLDFDKKGERLNKIALEAAKQSGRGIIPKVLPVMQFNNVIKTVTNQKTILYYEHGGNNTNSIIRPNDTNINLIVGSE
ncbi:MAG: RsmE family RNA methyltransferase, partial [Oscillospiraceae bacterium]